MRKITIKSFYALPTNTEYNCKSDKNRSSDKCGRMWRGAIRNFEVLNLYFAVHSRSLRQKKFNQTSFSLHIPLFLLGRAARFKSLKLISYSLGITCGSIRLFRSVLLCRGMGQGKRTASYKPHIDLNIENILLNFLFV